MLPNYIRGGQRMFDSLKKLSMKQVMKKVSIAFGIMVIILISFGPSYMKLIEGPKDLSALSIEEMPGAYVKGELYYIFDQFAYYYNENDDGTEDITDQYYFILIGEDKLMGLHVKTDDFEIANQIFNESYDFDYGQREELTTSWQLKGTINKMEGEVLEFFQSYFVEAGVDAGEVENYSIPYVLEVDYVGSFDSFAVYASLAVFILLLAYVIITLVKGAAGVYISPIKKYISKNELTVALESMESDYTGAKSIDNFIIGPKWSYFFHGNKAQVVENSTLLWVYRENNTQRLYGIKIHDKKSLIMYTKDKKKLVASMHHNYDIDSVIEELVKQIPGLVTGYSKELEKSFKKDFENFGRQPEPQVTEEIE
jgi:hypothetical protein